MNIVYRGHNAIDVCKTANSMLNLVDYMKSMPQIDMPVKHHFSDGVYAREIFMPAGTIVIGKIHKTKHLNIVSKGKCFVVTPVRRLEIEAPYTFESVPGEQKALHIIEDTIWTTIHVTDETNVDTLESNLVTEEYNEELMQSLIGVN